MKPDKIIIDDMRYFFATEEEKKKMIKLVFIENGIEYEIYGEPEIDNEK